MTTKRSVLKNEIKPGASVQPGTVERMAEMTQLIPSQSQIGPNRLFLVVNGIKPFRRPFLRQFLLLFLLILFIVNAHRTGGRP